MRRSILVSLALVSFEIFAPASRAAIQTAAPGLRSPNPSSTKNVLTDVSAVSGSKAWAVGDYIDDSTGATDGLILQWDGISWSQVASPNPSSTSNSLTGVSALSDSNAWAV